MRPSIKNSLAIFSPSGFLDGESSKHVIEPQDITLVEDKRCESALVSLKKIVFFNKRGLGTIVELLNQIQKRTGAIVGFCDYDNNKYKMILDMHQQKIDFSLFETNEIATLFIGLPLSENPEEKKIVVYNEDSEQKNHLVLELYERGYKPFIPKSEEEFKSCKNNYEYIVSNSYISFLDRQIDVHIKDNVIVYSLKGFVDSSLSEEFDIRYHENCLKVGFVFFLFNAHDLSSINIRGVNFLTKLSNMGAEHGATIAICGLNDSNITKALKNDLEDSGVLFYRSMKDFFNDKTLLASEAGGGHSFQKTKHITKQLVEVLPLITKTVTNTLEVMTRVKAVKQSLKIQPISLQESSTMMGVAIAFYGDLEGLFVVALEESLAKKACKVFLEEDNVSRGDLMDALGEFVNIIGGKFIHELQKKHCKIDITMPRTFGNVSEILQHKKDKKGAQVNFIVEDTPLVLFLTK